MNHPQPARPKRSTMACIHCRERKIKCDNNNDGLSCERCKKTKRDCRYEPVAPVSDPLPASLQGDPPITGDKPIMTVYQDSLPSTPTPPQVHWPQLIDPNLRETYAQGHPLPTFDSLNTGTQPQNFQPPHAFPHTPYPVGPWQQPFIQPHATHSHFPYGHENPFSAGHQYWPGTRGPNMPNDKSGDRPEDDDEEPSGSS